MAEPSVMFIVGCLLMRFPYSVAKFGEKWRMRANEPSDNAITITFLFGLGIAMIGGVLILMR